jgi:hypothetical protein
LNLEQLNKGRDVAAFVGPGSFASTRIKRAWISVFAGPASGDVVQSHCSYWLDDKVNRPNIKLPFGQ